MKIVCSMRSSIEELCLLSVVVILFDSNRFRGKPGNRVGGFAAEAKRKGWMAQNFTLFDLL